MIDELYMRLALKEAWKYQLLTYPNPAVGAVVVQNGCILSVEAHQKAGKSHAEILALLGAYSKLSNKSVPFDKFDAQKAHEFLLSLPKGFFAQCDIYITLEPCSHIGKTPSCASLIRQLNLKRVIIGTLEPVVMHSGGAASLKNVMVGVLENECHNLIEPFIIWQNRAFVLFKIAQTSNGRIGGKYISSKASLEHTHKLREVCDRLLIGGSTVRIDRPVLDCRFSGGKAPDVCIYSREDDFDKEIPLFGVSNRKVEIIDSLSLLENPSFVIVEGGEGMINAFKDKIDYLLIYQTPKLSANPISYNVTMNLEVLHTEKKDIDLIIWSRNIGG